MENVFTVLWLPVQAAQASLLLVLAQAVKVSSLIAWMQNPIKVFPTLFTTFFLLFISSHFLTQPQDLICFPLQIPDLKLNFFRSDSFYASRALTTALNVGGNSEKSQGGAGSEAAHRVLLPVSVPHCSPAWGSCSSVQLQELLPHRQDTQVTSLLPVAFQ